MGLSEDQKAMLRLLAQREQGYDDIAALMGISVEEVRERVKGALEQLDAEGKAPPEELPPAGPVAAGDPPPPPVAKASSGVGPPTAPPAGEELPVEPAPAPPPAPKEPSSQAAPAAKGQTAARPARQLPKLSLPEGQGARTGLAAGALALVVLVVVLVVGGGGDGSETTSSSSGGTAANGEPTSGNVKRLTKAVLQPADGSGAAGVAIFGRVKNSLALQVEAEGLQPTAKGRSYAVWVAASPQRMLPLASTAVGQDGRIATQFKVPTEVLAYLANETFGQIAITEVEDSRLNTALNKATSEKQAPSYTGTEVLRGTITGPIIGAANKGGN